MAAETASTTPSSGLKNNLPKSADPDKMMHSLHGSKSLFDKLDQEGEVDIEEGEADISPVEKTASEMSEDLIRVFPRSAVLGSFFSIPLGFTDKEMEKLYHRRKIEQTENSLRWLVRFVSVAVIFLFVLNLPTPLSREAPPTYIAFVATNYISPPLIMILVRTLIRRVPRRWKDELLVGSLGLTQALYIAASSTRLAFFLDAPVSQVAPLDVGYSDSAVVGYCGLFIVTAFSLIPLRCRSLLPMLLWIPGCYLALSLPMPNDIADRSTSARIGVAIGLLLQCLTALAAKSHMELSDRAGFAGQMLQRRELFNEKVRRVQAEHKAENGPFHERSGCVELGGRSGSDIGLSSGCPSSSAFKMDFVVNPETEQLEIPPFDEKMERIIKFAENEHWLIEANDLEVLHHCELGRGGFGKVVVGRLYGLPVAVKMSKSIHALRGINSLVNELRIFRRLRHPNIVMFHGACINVAAGEVLIVEEVVPGATLANLITPPPSPVRIKARCVILLRICKALRFLHLQTPAIMHGDLKPGNILVPQTMQPKLTDFGLARMIKDPEAGVHFRGGTRRWSSPESMRRGDSGQAGEVTISADIWSLGRVCYFTVTGEHPLETFDADATPWTGPDVPLQEECLELCKSCGQMEPTARPSIAEVHSKIWHWLPRKVGEVECPSVAEWLLDDTLLPPDAVPECDEGGATPARMDVRPSTAL